WKATHLLAEKFKPSTRNSYLCNLDLHIIPEFEHRGMQSITSGDINAFAAKLFAKKSNRKKGLSAKTVRNVLILLGKILADAVKDSRLRHSPMEGVELPAKSKKKAGRALKPEEIQALLANADEDARVIIMAAVLTGLRRAELFGLRWESVDFKANLIHV